MTNQCYNKILSDIEKEQSERIRELRNYNVVLISQEKYLLLMNYLNGIRNLKRIDNNGNTCYEINGNKIEFSQLQNGKMQGVIPKNIKFSDKPEVAKRLKEGIKSRLKEKI